MDNNEIVILDESSIKEMIYEIRGQKVMLDSDLARIYGYDTKTFNRQIKNNAERFPEEFRFQLREGEIPKVLRSQILTAKPLSSKRRYFPYVFTEQGIYMLMTVLKGELAVKQSITLIKLFKAMKDYAMQTEGPWMAETLAGLVKQYDRLDRDVADMKGDIETVKKAVGESGPKKEFLIMEGERIEAGIAYRSIYARAKHRVIVIDDYVDTTTLLFLKACAKGTSILLFSDNKGPIPLEEKDLERFFIDKGIRIELRKTHGRVHDRYIFLDYGYKREELYLCGSSSKDAGSRIGAILKAECPMDFHRLVESLSVD